MCHRHTWCCIGDATQPENSPERFSTSDYLPYKDGQRSRAQSIGRLYQAMTMSSVGLGLSGACDLPGRLLKERALPGLLGCVLMDGRPAAVRAAPCCIVLCSARIV